MRYLPALDGLRACAVLLVIFHHAGVPGFIGGGMGVDIFFVLSGFLITALLLQEIGETGRLNLLHFYLRRALRLYPALLLLLLLYALGSHALGLGSAREALVAGLYLTDFAIVGGYVPPAGLLSHTWSLSIEEHFYLLWPPLLLLAVRFYPGKKLARALGCAFLLTAAWKCWCMYSAADTQAGMVHVYYRFDARLDGLLLGAFLAACRRQGCKIRALDQGLLLSGLAGLFCLVTMPSFAGKVYESVVAEAFAFFLLAKVLEGESRAPARWLALPACVFVGRLSYGLYLFHYPVTTVLTALPKPLHWPLVLSITLALSFALSYFSWRTVERLGRIAAGKYRRDHASEPPQDAAQPSG